MRAPVRIAAAVLGLAVATYGTATLTGGWLWVPSHQPTERPEDPHLYWRLLDNNASTGSPSVAAPALKDSRTVSDFGWPVPWYQRTEDRYVNISPAEVDRWTGIGPMDRLPVVLVTRIGPRSDLSWMAGAVIAAGLALVAFGAWPRRRRMPA